MVVKIFIGRIFRKIAHYCNNISVALLFDKNDPNNISAQRVIKWFKDNGDKTHRLKYDLDPDSVVFDLGGYEGQWSSDIFSMYGCNIFIFEPYPPFAINIEQRFKKNSKIKIYKFGLGARSEKVDFSILNDGSSIYAKGDSKVSIDLVSVIEFLKDHEINSIDLVKINIEGGEYELLEYLIENGLIKVFKNIQVQFHDFIISNASERMKQIQNELSRTHFLTYQYNFVWENWEKKNSCN